MKIGQIFATVFGLVLCMAGGAVHAEPPAFVSSVPAAESTVSSAAAGISVHFSRPVDHLHSSLTILQNDKVVATLRPLADSAADVLFSRRPSLPPGAYQLHWTVRSLDGQQVLNGDVPFSVE